MEDSEQIQKEKKKTLNLGLYLQEILELIHLRYKNVTTPLIQSQLEIKCPNNLTLINNTHKRFTQTLIVRMKFLQ